MKINLRSISFKIIIPILVVLMVSTLVLTGLVNKSVKNHWLANSEATVNCDADIVTNLMERELDVTKAITSQAMNLYISLYALSGNGVVSKAFMSQLCDPIMKDHNMTSISIYDANMNLVSPPEYKRQNTDDIKLALRGTSSKKFTIDNNILEAVSAQPIIFGGKTIGAVEITKELSSESFMNRFPESVGCEFTIVKDDVRLHTTIDGQKGTKINPAVYEILKNGKTWCGVVDINGEDYIGYYWPYEKIPGAAFFVGESVEAMNKATRKISSVIWFLQVSANIFVMVLVIVLMLLIIIKPINATNAAILNLSSGDADLTMRLPSKGHDEITQLSKGVNKFIETLQTMMKTIFEKSESVNEVISDLGATAQETASACTEIMANIESVKNQANNQSSAVNNTSTIVQESDVYMNKLNENIVAQTSDITESSSAIEEMIGNINAVTSSANKMSDSFVDLTKLIKEGSDNVKACTEVIKHVEDKSKVLAEANNTIKTISSQTNLLAMNAMIESAHAGEAGKGFAVVAEEIRKLAENSSKQASSIEENIKEIINLISEGGRLSILSQKSFESIDGQVNVVDPIVRQIAGAMDEQSAGSSQILEALSDMKEESVSVDDSSKQLNEEFNKIRTNMDAVAMVSDTILGSMDEMSAGSMQISKATQNVSDLALNTKQAMDGINALIGKFKV